MRNFKDLKIWQRGMEIVKETYFLTHELPDEEKFGLISQMRRSARSIPANIAEGSSRRSKKDFARFIEIAEGSSYELETDLLILEMLGLGDGEKINTMLESLDQEQKMLRGFSKTLSDD